jgi:hypothetical protein
MVGKAEAHSAGAWLGAILAVFTLLLVLPSILVSLWHSLAFSQQLDIIAFLALAGAAAVCLVRCRSRNMASKPLRLLPTRVSISRDLSLNPPPNAQPRFHRLD